MGWNPSFPCCFIKLDEYTPVVRSASNKVIRHKAVFTLYIAEKNSLGFELIQQLIEDLNDTMLQLPPLELPTGPNPIPPPEPETYDPDINTYSGLETDPETGPPLIPVSETYYVEVNAVKFLTAINSVRVHTLQITIF